MRAEERNAIGGKKGSVVDKLLTLWEDFSPHPRARRPIVLSFHDVRSAEWLRSLGEVLRRAWSPLPLLDFIRRHRMGTLSRENLALTFDDGFKSIRTIVEPVLSDLKIPFVTFVCGDVLVGGSAPWFYRVESLLRHHSAQRLADFWGLPAAPMTSGFVLVNALKSAPFPRILDGLDRAERTLGADPAVIREDFLSSSELAALVRNPFVTVGSHTMRHPILSALTAEEQAHEIARSAEVLARIVGYRPRLFAYPNGKLADFGAETIDALRRNGFEGAVTTVQRPVAPNDDSFRLPRLGVSEGDGVWKIRLKRALPWPGRGDALETRTRRRFASTWISPAGHPPSTA